MIELKEMQACHVKAVAALERICFPSDCWPEAAFLPELTNPLSYWLVAMDGDTLVGYIGSQSVLGEADMMNVAVSPDYRRQGIAEKLILELISALSQRQVHCLSLEVRDSNIPAIGLYEKLGFVQVGLRPRYYLNPREDARILRKEWTA